MSAKTRLIEQIRDELRGRLARAREAASETRSAATDPASRAESKYDTRSLEASYLASGQARQADEAAEALGRFERFEAETFGLDDAIAAGALVETDLDGESAWYFLAPAAGGLVVERDGLAITLLSPSSRLYQNLLGRRLGDTVDETGHIVTELE